MPRIVSFDQTGAPDVLQIHDTPVGEPAAGQVRVSVEAVGVNRLDLLARAGAAPRPVRLPHARLGIEAAGRIDAVGADAGAWQVGDRVLLSAVPDMDTNGSYAEQLVVGVDRVVATPPELDPVHAGALWVSYSTAYGALIETAGMRPADHVLITAAASATGVAAIQLANQIGAIPIAVTRHSAKTDALLRAGAAAVIATDAEDIVARTQSLTGGAGADIIIDAVMGPGLADLAAAARPGGTLVTVGWLDPRPASFPQVAPLTIHRYMSFLHTLDPVVVRRIGAFLAAGVRSGVLAPVIDAVFGFDDVVAAHHHLENSQQVGKVVLVL